MTDERRTILTCQDVIGLVMDFLESALRPEAVRAFDEHLVECAECVAYLNTYKRTRDLTRRAARPDMPEEMKARLHRLLLRELAEGPER